MKPPKIPRIRVRGTTTTLTYVFCLSTAQYALEQAEKQMPGWFYSQMTAAVFSAFTVEGYLNHLGQERVRDWDALERKLGPREKLLLLRQLVPGLTADMSQRPFQTLTEMLQVRDALAHSKTETVKADKIVVANDRVSIEAALDPKPKWRALCEDPKSVKRMVEDAEAMVCALHKQAGYEGHPFSSPGEGEWSKESANPEA